MTSTLQIVDPDSLSTVLFDLNDNTGANSALYGSVSTFVLSDIDLGVPALSNNSGGSADIAKPLAFNRQATANMKFKLRVTGGSYDNTQAAIGTLSTYLAQGCVIKWVPNGSSETRYIDVLASPTPVLMSGQALALWEATVLLDSPEGVQISLERLGYTRGASLDSTTNKLLNSTPVRDSNADGTPDNWTKISTPTLSLDSSKNSLHVVAASSPLGVYQATGSASASSGQVWTFAADMLVASGTAQIRLDWRNSSDTQISTVQTSTTTASWARVSITGTAPATTDHIRATLVNTGGAATWDFRNAQLELASTPSRYRVGAETLHVDPAASGMAQFIPVFNPCTAPTPCVLTVASSDSSPTVALVEVDYALGSDKGIPGARRLADFLNGPAYAQADTSGNGWTRTLGTNVSGTADANASGGTTALYIPSSNSAAATPHKIVNLTRTTLLDSLRGRFKVYARVKGAGAVEYNLQLNWGMGTVAGESNDAVTHDCSNVTSFQWVYIDVGDIELPLEKNIAIGQLSLDLFGWQTDGTKANLYTDHLAFVPTDDSAEAAVGGATSYAVAGKNLTTPPDQLGSPESDPSWSAGTAKAGALRLNANHEACGLGDNTNGVFLGATNTRHIIRFDWQTHLATPISDFFVMNLQAANLTANAVTGYSANVRFPRTDTTDVVLDDTATILDNASPGSAGDAWQPRATITTAASNGFRLDINQITVFTVPYVPQNGQIRSDPGSQPTRAIVEQLDSSGNAGLECDATGTPFWIAPGLSLIYVNVFDTPNAGYDEAQSYLARTFTVTPTVYPRWWG